MENLGMIFRFYSDLQQIITINARRTNLMGKNVVLNKHFIKDFIKRNHAQLTEKQKKNTADDCG